ncbi:MAG: ACP S-malonyltransferase [Ruminiclostridium sp.]|nr:ACP S-malonyltransferase [Ruminiclostridium sp.]
MATALLFSGQGSQYSGMGRKLYDENPSAYDEIFSVGSEILGFDVKKTMFEGTAEELAVTSVSQPAIFTMSLMCAKKYALDGKEFAAVAGHSLGEYAALVTAGAVDLTTGFTLIKHRAACMDKAAKKNGGKMAAIIGLPSDVIETVCAEVNGSGDYVVPVNYNTSVQTVIAGSEAGVAKAAELLKAKGAKRAVPLAVAAAFHSDYMKEAGLEFKELIKDIDIAKPQKAFYSNVTGARLDDFSDIHDILSRHIYSPVRFTSELAAMQADGIDSFVECGPGKALTGMVKKTLEGITAEATDL